MRTYESLKLSNTYSNQTSDDFHLSRLSNTQANGSDGNDTLSQTLKGELERALATIKQKRLEAQQFQSEIEQLRGEGQLEFEQGADGPRPE